MQRGTDIPALSLGIDGVERKRRFPGARKTCYDDKSVPGKIETDILQVMLPGPANPNLSHYVGEES